MPAIALTKEKCLETLRKLEAEGYPSISLSEAARCAGVALTTASNHTKWLRHKHPENFKEKKELEQKAFQSISEVDVLRDELRTLKAKYKDIDKELLSESYIRSAIFKLSELKTEKPNWLIKKAPSAKCPGIPTLFASDWHWAEVVDPSQINGKNEYNIAIGKVRAKNLIENTINLLFNHMVTPEYPGIVFALGGDMVSGGIHDELAATDEMQIMPTVLDVHGVLVWCIETLANHFGKVFVPCVSGNHGRDTKKIWTKNRNFTSFDWLIYVFLEKHFEKDSRVQFYIPNGSDCLYSIYGHKYLLTHGDQFRGGDGMIGALGPVIRGDHKKRSRNGQIDMNYDTMIIGHWHQLIQLQRLIINGSLKGYDEYAYSNNFGFEVPRQALWITHPQHGITFSMPVMVENQSKAKSTDWISWSK